jgi:DNA-binding response OmpR family regulator
MLSCSEDTYMLASVNPFSRGTPFSDGNHATILVVEDERAVARGLIYGLRDEGFTVEWAETGKAALAMTEAVVPSLIVLDLRLPDITGLDVCRRLRQAGKRQPILMLTARDEEMDKVLGLELGADDYVVKPYSLRELVSRIRALLRRSYGELAVSTIPTTVSFGAITVEFERMLVMRDQRVVELTPIELRLLRVLVMKPRRPCSREQLIEEVWGYSDDVGSDRTVDVHMRHLRQKLEDDPAQPRWLVTVRGAGYKFEP